MKQPVLCIMASNLKNRRWEPRTWQSGNSGKQVNKRREWKSPWCWTRSALLTILVSYLMDSRLRGNDEENQSPGNHGFPPFPRVSPVIPAQVSPAIPAQVSPVIPAQVSPAILAGLPRHSRGSLLSFPHRFLPPFPHRSLLSFPHRSLPPFPRRWESIPVPGL